MNKKVLQQLENWWEKKNYSAITEKLNEVPEHTFTTRMWELFVWSCLHQGTAKQDIKYFYRAQSAMEQMLDLCVEPFEHWVYCAAFASMALDCDSDALNILEKYFLETSPEDRHEKADALYHSCLKRIGMPEYTGGTFQERVKRAIEKLTFSLPMLQLAMMHLALAGKKRKPNEEEMRKMESLLGVMMLDIAFEISPTMRWDVEVQGENRWVLNIHLGGTDNLAAIDFLLQRLREVLPKGWDIQLCDWEQFVTLRFDETFLKYSFEELMNYEQTYDTVPTEGADLFDAHLYITKGWTTEANVQNNFIDNESSGFDCLRMIGCYCATVCYDVALLEGTSEDLEQAVRAFNEQLKAFVQAQKGVQQNVVFTGGGYGPAAFAEHEATAYCDFMALDGVNFAKAFGAFFDKSSAKAVYVRAIHRDAEPVLLAELVEIAQKNEAPRKRKK